MPLEGGAEGEGEKGFYARRDIAGARSNHKRLHGSEAATLRLVLKSQNLQTRGLVEEDIPYGLSAEDMGNRKGEERTFVVQEKVPNSVLKEINANVPSLILKEGKRVPLILEAGDMVVDSGGDAVEIRNEEDRVVIILWDVRVAFLVLFSLR